MGADLSPASVSSGYSFSANPLSGTTMPNVSAVTLPNIHSIPNNGYVYQHTQPLSPLAFNIPVEEMDPSDARAGCPRCERERPMPVVPRGNHYKDVEGINHTRQTWHLLGHCGVCGTGLVSIACQCGEPLHDKERFCRNCGQNNQKELIKWHLHEDRPSPEELAARGNIADEEFRGVREE